MRKLWLAGAALGGLALYLRVLRPWQLRWGATDDELAHSMPGDDMVRRPSFDATRAVTIAAPPEAIWPWLVQIGHGRAGWYSYDWLDNLGKPSARRLLPEFQHLKVGDLVPAYEPWNAGFWVKAIEPNRWMLWGDKDQGNLTWLWRLYPLDERHTRLITRVRLRYVWTSPAMVFNLLLDVGDVVMMRKCMLGVKERVEGLPR